MNQRGPVYANGVMSPPPSKQASMQSRSSNGNPMYGFSQVFSNDSPSQNQAQLALYHDGFQVGSPQPMPQSPYPVPTPRSTQIEDPDYQEYLEFKRQKQLAQAERQQQQKQQQEQWVQQQQWHQQQQQRFPPSPPQPFPLPAHLQHQQQQQQGNDSAYGSMSDTDQQYQQQFAAPQPYVHSIRPGHKYGKITARGQAKIMLGNGVSGKSSGLERQHEYAEVDIDDGVQMKAGDFGAAEITSFFRYPERS